MSNSTAPTLIAGGISIANKFLTGATGATDLLPIALATTVAALALSLLEQIPDIGPPLATGIAWIAVVTTILTTKIVSNITSNVAGTKSSTVQLI